MAYVAVLDAPEAPAADPVRPAPAADPVRPAPAARALPAVSVLLIPLLLATVYVAVLIVRFPTLVGWLNTHGDYASAYVLADAIAHGHTGQVVMSTQGAWVSLWYGLLTHGLAFHRVLWEISPALLTVGTAALIGSTVSRVTTRSAGLLSFALILAASPTALLSFTAPWAHNSTLLGVALLGAFLVWLHDCRSRRSRRRVMAAVLGLSVVIGTFLASDQLLVSEGLLPFLFVPVLIALRSRDPRGLTPVLAVVGGSVFVSTVTTSVMHSLRFVTTASPLRVDAGQVPLHVTWLGKGLLRLAGGWASSPQASIRAPLTMAAGMVTVAALIATFRLAGRGLSHPGTGQERARAVHVTFWAGSLLCAATVYVVTTVIPADRYFLVAVPAMAATVPLLLDGGRGTRRIVIASTVIIIASLVALACGDVSYGTSRGVVARQATALEALVRARHLGIGYAGYWDASPLTWTSHERIRVYPVTAVYGHSEPMDIARVAAWYQARPRTPSYLVLAPGDNVLAPHLPHDLPLPEHSYRLGQAIVLSYPYDIAAFLHAPIN